MLRSNSYPDTATGGKLHLFSIYTEFGMCRRVKWIANAIARLAGHRWQCTSEMWKLDLLTNNGAMGKILADDAARADVLIAVVGSLARRQPELMNWLAGLRPLTPDRYGMLVGLLGDDADKGQELDWTAKQLIHRAQESNRKFIWHWMGHHDADPSDWLDESIQTLLGRKQSVLQPILAREPVAVV